VGRASSKVQKVSNKDTGNIYAVKLMPCTKANNKKQAPDKLKMRRVKIFIELLFNRSLGLFAYSIFIKKKDLIKSPIIVESEVKSQMAVSCIKPYPVQRR
jgi:hypothetical protein